MPVGSFDRSLCHQVLEDGRFMILSGRQDEGHGLATSLRSQMQFGAETTLAATQSFVFWPSPFAPAAC